jgi:uncharacterized protein YqeY
MLVDDIKAKVTQAVKEKNEVVRDVLRLALGEIQTAEARASATLGDAEVTDILRKLVKSNTETLAAVGDGPQAPALRLEIEVLSSLLPKRLTVPQLIEALASQRDAIRAAKNDGQATGVAMKHLKTTGAAFDGNDVSAAVKTLRA